LIARESQKGERQKNNERKEKGRKSLIAAQLKKKPGHGEKKALPRETATRVLREITRESDHKRDSIEDEIS